MEGFLNVAIPTLVSAQVPSSPPTLVAFRYFLRNAGAEVDRSGAVWSMEIQIIIASTLSLLQVFAPQCRISVARFLYSFSLQTDPSFLPRKKKATGNPLEQGEEEIVEN